MNTDKIPLLGFSAYSGTGKTTLLEKLIPRLRQKNLRVAVIKHAHHDFDIDYPEKDSYRLRKAGAIETLVASKYRWALICEQEKHQQEPDLFELINHLNTSALDLVLVEGFKHESFPRIEIHRTSLNNPPLYLDDEKIIAVATDSPQKKFGNLRVLDLNNAKQIIHFILERLNHETR